jgi:hypothetical protein
MGLKYIVRHGAMRFLGEYEAADGTTYARAARVLVRSDRGLELGQVLGDANPQALGLITDRTMAAMPPVSMRMAKLQKSTLDPSKISGRCGRLKCCLRFEQDVYEEFQKQLPPPGTRVVTRKGQGRVLAQEILARKVLVEFEDGRRLVVGADDVLTRIGSQKDNGSNP